jgi:hypothetical protein
MQAFVANRIFEVHKTTKADVIQALEIVTKHLLLTTNSLRPISVFLNSESEQYRMIQALANGLMDTVEEFTKILDGLYTECATEGESSNGQHANA